MVGLAAAGWLGCGDADHGREDRSASTAARPQVVGPRLSHRRWTRLPASRLARTEVSAAAVGENIYLVGGFETRTGRSTAAVEHYEPARRRWSRVRAMPRTLNHASAFSHAGELYVLGGYASAADTSTKAVASFWRYDPRRDRWSALPRRLVRARRSAPR